MNLEIIKNKIGRNKIGHEIIFFEELDSTNAYAKNMAKDAHNGTVIISEKQNLGRGRHGKTWDSPAGVGIWMSVVLKPLLKIEDAVKMPAMVSLVVREGIEKSTGLDTKIKWPNDIIVNKKKVCGILVESQFQNGAADYFIVGIGVNVNQEESFFKEIPWASSLSIEKKEKLVREEIIAEILASLEKHYNAFLETKSLDMDNLYINSVLLNKMVRVSFDNEEMVGQVTGFKEDGSILIKSNNNVININSLKVSIRGINGYID